MTDLQRIKELLAKAQQPWTAWIREQLTASDFPTYGDVIGLRWVQVDRAKMLHPDDAQLIALLRNTAPSLIARIEALEAALRPFAEGGVVTVGHVKRAKELLEERT